MSEYRQLIHPEQTGASDDDRTQAQVAATRFADYLRGTGEETEEPVGGVSLMETPQWKYLAFQGAVMDRDAVDGLVMEVSIPEVRPGEINPDIFAERLVGSMLAGVAEDTRLLLYLEKSLGFSIGEVIGSVREYIKSLDLNETSRKSLFDQVSAMRQYARRLHDNGDNIEIRLVDKSEIGIRDVVESKRDVNISSGEYLMVRSSESLEVESADGIETWQSGNVLAVVVVCDEYRTEGDYDQGQDSVAVVDGEESILMVVADGVSQSFMGGYSSKEIVKYVVSLGTANLHSNWVGAAEACRVIHEDMVVPDTGIPMLNSVLAKKKNKAGSQSTLLQLRVDKKSGVVTGLLGGDGLMMVVRKGGRVEKWENWGRRAIGPDSVLSTKFGAMGTPMELVDVTGELVLSEGDYLLLSTDGIHGHRVEEVAQALSKGEVSSVKEIVAREAVVDSKAGEHDDDRGVVVYRQGQLKGK